MNRFPAHRLAVCTTIHPGVLRFVGDWYASLRRQTDRDFRLWIALDGLEPQDIARILGERPQAEWVMAPPGETPAGIRQLLLAQVVTHSTAVVLVDSDDVMHAHRVASARTAMAEAQLSACALRLVDHSGREMGVEMGLPEGWSVDDVLPRYNIFGLSNTAWRADLLQACLPVPPEVEIVDWFLATRAWLLRATLHFHVRAGMDYRQHASNMVRVRPPFPPEQVLADARRVCRHLQLVLAAPPSGADAQRLRELRSLYEEVDCFSSRMAADAALLNEYAGALAALDLPTFWWSSVAHPALRHLWSDPFRPSK